MKKRKRSKKKGDEKKKKKVRRDAYVSSANSDSESSSTCKYDDNSSSDEGISRGRSRGRSREKKMDHRDSKKGRNKNRSRMRSFSPSNSYDDESIEKVTVENNSRRLKSVITVVKPPENEEDDMNKDEPKEEIVYDYDDYPSCKSNDSNEIVDRSNVVGEVDSMSKEKESNVSGKIASEVDNLELILRQKALENLSKFRGGTKPKTLASVDNKHKSDQSGVKPLASLSLGQTQRRVPAQEQDGFSMTPTSPPIVPRSRFTWRRDASVTTGKEQKAATHSGSHTSGSQPAAPKLQSARLSSSSRVENNTLNEEKAATYSGPHSNKSQPAALELQSAHLSSTSRVENKTVNEENSATYSGPLSGDSQPAAPKLQSARLSPTSGIENKTVSDTSKIMANANSTSGGTETNVDQKSTAALETPSSASSAKEGSSKEQQNETTDNSQFEKKTMSVMRGGEMVQVSVYCFVYL